LSLSCLSWSLSWRGSFTDCRGKGGLTFRSDVLQHATSMRDKTVRDSNIEATMVGGRTVNLGSCKGTKGRKRRSWGETRDERRAFLQCTVPSRASSLSSLLTHISPGYSTNAPRKFITFTILRIIYSIAAKVQKYRLRSFQRLYTFLHIFFYPSETLVLEVWST